MLNRSILTAIIGFLVGCLFYYQAEASVVIVLIMGCTGYFFGLFLDYTDIKDQYNTFRFSTLPSTQEIFQSTDLPEALIFYSSKENLTTVSIDFQVETKSQSFRLSVLKNLREYQFRILEDSNKTVFSLTMDFPECNYPKLSSSSNHKEEFLYNIRERSLDFQNAVQKIVPGLVLSKIFQSDISKDKKAQNGYSFSPKSPRFPPSAPSLNNNPPLPLNGYKMEKNPSIPKADSEGIQAINETQIMEDLMSGSSMEQKFPDLSPDEVQQLTNSNQRQLEVFLNEEEDNTEVIKKSLDGELSSGKLKKIDDINIDFSNVNQPRDEIKEDFNQEIINRLEERTKIALNQGTSDLDLQKERDGIKKYINGEVSTEESHS